MTEAATAQSYCADCGARRPAGARFCAGCGRRLAAPPTAAPAPRTLRDQLPGLAVLTLFLAAGLAIWVSVLRPGSRSGGTAPPSPGMAGGVAASGGAMPPDHPPLTLPDEAKKFIASLAAKAEAAPNDAAAWRTLAQVQARAAEVDPSYGDQAIASYRRALDLAKDDPDALRGLANVHYDRQQFAAAAEQYERYLERQPDDPNVRTDLGTAYLYQRQIDRAIDTYKQVLAANPDFMQAYFNLGLAYEAKGNRADALASLAKARSLAPDDTTRSQIDRVTAQLTGEAAAGAPQVASAPPAAGAPQAANALPGAGAPQGAAVPPGAAPPRGAAAGVPQVAGAPQGAGAPRAGAAPAATDFHGSVEAALRSHQILGPRITAIEWPEANRAVVRVAEFPVESMPEFARNLFRARLETILDDAKTQHAVRDEQVIELVDAGSGASLERVAH